MTVKFMHLAVGGHEADRVRKKLPLRLAACGNAVPVHESDENPDIATCRSCREVYMVWANAQEDDPSAKLEHSEDEEVGDDDSEEGSGAGGILESLVPDGIVVLDEWRIVYEPPVDDNDPRAALTDEDRDLIIDLCGMAESIAPTLAAALGSAFHRALFSKGQDRPAGDPRLDEVLVSLESEVVPEDIGTGLSVGQDARLSLEAYQQHLLDAFSACSQKGSCRLAIGNAAFHRMLEQALAISDPVRSALFALRSSAKPKYSGGKAGDWGGASGKTAYLDHLKAWGDWKVSQDGLAEE